LNWAVQINFTYLFTYNYKRVADNFEGCIRALY
jgi:hypothetical protein